MFLMMTKEIVIDYSCDGVDLQGVLAYPEGRENCPAVLIAHAWKGRDQFVIDKAHAIAKLGYAAFAADVYGKGVFAQNNDEALELMLPLFQDRKLLQSRINEGLGQLKTQKMVDPSKTAAIGYCFGGLTVLELLRSGAKQLGIVSFHGVLADALGEVNAVRPKNNKDYHGKALFIHGNDDPLVSQQDIKNVWIELDEKEADWQFHTYGGTSHAFTNPEANFPDDGLIYSPQAAKRAWDTLKLFLKELFEE